MSKKFISILTLALVAGSLQAQDADSTKSLAEVVVTANKFPGKQTETGKVLTVITQEQLQKSYGRSLAEVLNLQVGFTINGATNTAGTNQTVYMRGGSAASTLILIDGVPLYDASGTSSEFDLNNFSLYTIERIEILKGSQSTLYGSDAVAGVINIITKKTAGKGAAINFIGSVGSYGTYKASVSVSGKIKGVEYFAGYNKFISRGLSAAHDTTGKKDFEKDPFRQQLVQASVGGKLFSKLHARIYTKYNENRTDIDAGAFTDDKDYRLKNRNFIVGTNFVYTLPSGAINFNYNYNHYNRYFKDDSGHVGGSASSFYNIFQEGKYKSRSQFAELYSNLKLSKRVEILAGADLRRNASDQSYVSISNFGPFASMPLSEDSINTRQYSGFATLMFKDLSDYFLDIGGRWNHHSVYGDNITYSINQAYVYGHYKVFTNISSGFRAPSLYQLYSEYGNKDLKPEKSRSIELGVEYTAKSFTARVVTFHRRVTDVFNFYTHPATFASKYINDDKQKDNGVELEASYSKPGKYSISANYTNVHGKITTDDGSGKDTTYFNLYRRPRHTFNFNTGYHFTSKLFVQLSLHAVSKFYEGVFAAAPIEMKGYYTLNLYTEYNLRKKIKVFADVRNITNLEYFETRGFNSKGINVDAGVSVGF